MAIAREFRVVLGFFILIYEFYTDVQVLKEGEFPEIRLLLFQKTHVIFICKLVIKRSHGPVRLMLGSIQQQLPC